MFGLSASGRAPRVPRYCRPGMARCPTSSSAWRLPWWRAHRSSGLLRSSASAAGAICRSYQDVSFEFSRDYHGPTENGGDDAGLNVFTRKGGAIRHFLGGEIIGASADPGQNPRGAPDLTPLWTIPDVTPQGRETDGYPKLNYALPACALLRKCAGSARAFPSQIGTARQRPALNPHLTKSRLNDALRLCEMHRRNFG